MKNFKIVLYQVPDYRITGDDVRLVDMYSETISELAKIYGYDVNRVPSLSGIYWIVLDTVAGRLHFSNGNYSPDVVISRIRTHWEYPVSDEDMIMCGSMSYFLRMLISRGNVDDGESATIPYRNMSIKAISKESL